MSSSDAQPSPPSVRSRATLHAEAANACLADRGIIEIAIANLIVAREAKASAGRLQSMMEDTKNILRSSIDRFEGVQDYFASMKLLGLFYALDPSEETLAFLLERLRATQQWDMAEVVQKMLEDKAD